MERRRGPLTAEDKKYISDFYLRKSPEELAKFLNRDPQGIKDFLKKHNRAIVNNPEHEAIKASPVWIDIQRQFNDEELKMFSYHYSRILSQFSDDVFATEEIQVIDMVKLEIMMNRNLIEQRNTALAIADLELQIKQAQAIDDKPTIAQLNLQISQLNMTYISAKAEYHKMADEKKSILKDMKSTRADRIKNIEGAKNSFAGWMKEVITNKHLKESAGLHMEKMRLATIVEKRRLSELHTYEDGNVDQPLLTPETLIGEDEDGQEDSTDNGS